MPKSVLNCSLVASQGKYSFDPVTKVLMWDVGEYALKQKVMQYLPPLLILGKIDHTKLPNIRGNVNLVSGATQDGTNPTINVQFTIAQLAVSGLKVNR